MYMLIIYFTPNNLCLIVSDKGVLTINMTMLILHRLFLMLLYIIPGYVLYKKQIISDEGARDLGKLLLYLILPAAIINSYNIPFSTQKAWGLLISFLAAALSLFLSILVSRILFGKKKPLECFGTAFSNAGFMGIPLVQSVIGADAVYYAAAFVALLNILQWTYGVYIITGDRKTVSLKKILFNPVLISFFIGIVLFLLPVRLPDIVTELMGTIAGMNAPVAMLIIGMYLAQIPFLSLFRDLLSYKASFVRLFLIPALTLLLLAVLPWGDSNLKQTILILAAAPVGSNVAVYARLYHADYKQAVKEVLLSTLLCIASMPLLIGLSGYIL